MRKLKLMKTLLVAAGLCVGASNVWADEVFGTTSDGYLAAKSTSITMYDGGTLHYEFTQATRATNNYDGFVIVAENRGGTKLIALRQDNWDNVAGSNTGCTNDYNWTNFPTLMNGASVDMTITYNSGTFTMTSTVRCSDNNNYSYGYTKAISGSPAAIVVYLSEEAAQITLTTSDYSDSNVIATLDHTAGSQWGSNTGASTVDAEKEHYNNDASSAWAGCAYAKFSYTIPNGHSITSAILTYSVNQGGSSGRNDIIYYMAKDFDIDWATFAGQTGNDLRNTTYRAGKAVATAPTGGKGDRFNLTQDVTAAVNAIYSAGQNFILFQWTGNAGGADLFGKGSTANAPILVIKTSVETLYTATFTETNNASPVVTIYSDEGRTVEVTNGTLRNGITYYYKATLTGYEDYTGSFTVSGANPSVSFTMTAKTAVASITVKYKFGGDEITSEAGDATGLYVGETHTVPFRMYVQKAGKLYKTAANGSDPYYGENVTLTENTIVEKNVTEVNLNGGTIVLFEDLDAGTGDYAGIRASYCSAYGNTSYTSPDDLPAGLYTFIFRGMSRGRGSSVKVGETTILNASEFGGTNLWSDKTITNVSIPTDGKLTFVKGGSNTIDYYDIIIAIKQNGLTGTIASSGYSSLASAYGLDFANATGLTAAYVVTKTTNDAVTLTSVDELPANSGVILKGESGATYSIPVKADATYSGTNLLSAAVAATSIIANSAYILQGGQFHLVTADSEVPAGKAYLSASNVPSAARALGFMFSDEVEGISAVSLDKQNGEFYNLQGQRVNSPKKGLYIVNGTKVIIK